MQTAVAAQRAGSIAEAKRLYALVLSIDPSNAAACGNLGIIAAQQGDLANAERLMRQEIGLRPNNAASHHNLGTVLQQQGRMVDAADAHRQAVLLNPNYAQAQLALGNALKAQHMLDGAMQAYQAALAIKPDYPEAHNNIGVVLQMQGRLGEAASAFSTAAATPVYAEASFNLGVVLHQMGDLDAAEAAYRTAIARQPEIAVAHNNLGTVLKDQDRLDAAVTAFEQAIALKPDYAEAIYNHATVLQQQGKLEDALAAYGRALALRPDHLDAINNAGIVLQELGRHRDAIELYRRVVGPSPAAAMRAHADLYNNLGTALLAEEQPAEARAAFELALACRRDFPEAAYNLGNALRELGDLQAAIAAWRGALALRPDHADAFSQLVHHRALVCAWDDREAEQAQLVEMVRSGVRVPPFYLFATPASAADQLRCAEQWIRPLGPPQGARFGHGVRNARERIRLGYLSGDFFEHATARLMAELFESHDRGRFEVYAYSYGADDGSPMRARLVQAFDRFVDIAALSHRDAAGRIHDDKIDILIDLKGYTHRARPAIAACRPAPVQVSYLGFPATMGADFIDYVLVDRFVVPEKLQAFFTERLVHLPECYQANDRKREVASGRTARSDWGLPERGLVFCCFNNSYKLSPCLFDIWMRLLKAAPGSVLWLLGANAVVEANLRVEAGRRDIDPSRLMFAPVVPTRAHLERHRHADLFLDTTPCNAHTTASDALWCGVPVLTCCSETFAGRVAGSLLRAIGIPELVTHSLQEYERTALALIGGPDRLRALRQQIERNRDVKPLFDLPKLTEAIEAAYQRMWQRWLVGEKPVAFAIENV
ncbi:tetratricopeptide repeat protein [Bradyrhizobium sp.]|uniref:tetratricopeptide repeat protein n=1 Tax=Bradyrhizobium sp. TaxID=376 RepID=UPI003C620231